MNIELDIIISVGAAVLAFLANGLLYFVKEQIKHIHSRIDSHKSHTEKTFDKIDKKLDANDEVVANIKVTLAEIKQNLEFIKSYCKKNGFK